MTIILQKGSVVWSKTKGTWLIFDTDEAGDYFYDPRYSNDDRPSCYGIAEVGLDSIELPARQLHLDAATGTAGRYRSAINKAWTYFNRSVWGDPTRDHAYVEGFQAALHFMGLRLAESEPRKSDVDD